MIEWWGLLEKDIMVIISAFSPKDLAYPFALILWIILIRMSLHGVDQRDNITGFCYTLYCTATGVTLFFALPGSVMDISDIAIHFALVTLFACIAAYRWLHQNEQIVIFSGDSAKKKTKQRDLDHEKA